MEVHRHTEEAEKMFSDLLEWSYKDDEEATRVRRERNDLHQRDAESCQRVLDLQSELEKEKGLTSAA